MAAAPSDIASISQKNAKIEALHCPSYPQICSQQVIARCGLWPFSEAQGKTRMCFCLDTVAKEKSGEGGSQAT